MNLNPTKAFFNNQIQRMVAFIEHEAQEKQEEIDIKSEGDSDYEKGQIITVAREQLVRLYDKKQKQLAKQQIIDTSKLRNDARIRTLAVTEAHVSNIIAEVQARMVKHLLEKTFYKDLLFKLVMQGLFLILEEEVLLRVREEDVALINSMLDKLETAYVEITHTTVRLAVLDEFLPKWSLGGVELSSVDNKCFVQNTFHSRLQLIIHHVIPLIREGLFGYVPRTSVLETLRRKNQKL